jgi:hypothetical protein
MPEQAGRFRLTIEMQPGWLASGSYSIDVTTSVVNSSWDHYVDHAATIEVMRPIQAATHGTSSMTTATAPSPCRALDVRILRSSATMNETGRRVTACPACDGVDAQAGWRSGRRVSIPI